MHEEPTAYVLFPGQRVSTLVDGEGRLVVTAPDLGLAPHRPTYPARLAVVYTADGRLVRLRFARSDERGAEYCRADQPAPAPREATVLLVREDD